MILLPLNCRGLANLSKKLALRRLIEIQHAYCNRINLWKSLLSKSYLEAKNMILGGDLNFSVGYSEVWGPSVDVFIALECIHLYILYLVFLCTPMFL